jgi:hypothetical protein
LLLTRITKKLFKIILGGKIMAGIDWELEDPLIDNVKLFKDDAGFWNVSVVVREATPGSLGKNVIVIRLTERGSLPFQDKEVARMTWPVSKSRTQGEVASNTFEFNTGSAAYPTHMKIGLEVIEQQQ